MRLTANLVLRILSAACLLVVSACHESPNIDYSGPTADWSHYGGAAGGGHFSNLEQITADNVHLLEQAWVYRSGDYRLQGDAVFKTEDGEAHPMPQSSFQATPIVVNNRLYFCTPFNRVVALEPNTGKQIWRYDPQVNTDIEPATTCRGVSSWVDTSTETAPDGLCKHRIFTGTLDSRLIALDANTGLPCADFGNNGIVDLNDGLSSHQQMDHSITSPPAVLNDLVIVGASVIDSVRMDVPSGVVRAYHAKTGALVWYWDPIPPNSKPRYDESGRPQYRNGSANVWSIISVDPERELVFLPTGNTSPDHYGGQRDNLDYYSSSVIALNGNNGQVVWHFQTVHHDLWDYDVPSQPTLFELKRDGETIPALAQPTKMGHLFILHRETGKPLFPVEERPVPQGGVAGEKLSPTQPFPLLPKPLHAASFGPDDAYGMMPWDNSCRDLIGSMRADGIFTPPSLQGSVLFPGPAGGNNWGSPAIDLQQNIIVLKTMHLAFSLKLVPREECDKMSEFIMRPQLGTPYCAFVEPLLSSSGVPCNAPPWSTLDAISLDSGEHLWRTPLGTSRDMAPFPFWFLKGVPSIGGPMTTAAGLTFIASTADYYLRAFETATGKELWKGRLPTAGNATPMTYRVTATDKQYVVIAAGGHLAGQAPAGDYLIAFALADKN